MDKNKNELEFWSNFGKFSLAIIGLIINPIINGFLLLKLWGWFIIPVFDADPILYSEAIGVAFVISWAKAKSSDASHLEKMTFAQKITHSLGVIIVFNLIALIVGWFFSLFL